MKYVHHEALTDCYILNFKHSDRELCSPSRLGQPGIRKAKYKYGTVKEKRTRKQGRIHLGCIINHVFNIVPVFENIKIQLFFVGF